MRFVKYIISAVILNFCLSIGSAQNIRVWQPEVLNDVSGLMITPSMLQRNRGVYVGNQSFFGSYSDVRSFYAFGSTFLGDSEERGIGFVIRSQQEGKLIGETRLKVNYWNEIYLNRERVLVLGAQAGAANVFLRPTRSTAGGSAWAPDMDVSLSLLTIRMRPWIREVSFSSNQLTNSTIQPLSQKISFRRYYSSRLDFRLLAGPAFTLSMLTYAQVAVDFENVYRFKVCFNWKGYLKFGAGLGSDGARFSVMLPKIKESKDRKFVLGFGYQIPLKSTISPAYQPFQIHAGYMLTNSSRVDMLLPNGYKP